MGEERQANAEMIPPLQNKVTNVAIRAGLLLCLVWSGYSSARAGLSRMFSEYSGTTSSVNAGEKAVALEPKDPEAHYVQAMALANNGQLDESLNQLRRAVELRPKDYFLWQELGRIYDENNESADAIKALQTATLLAPYYAQPHWQLGNVLLRDNQTAAAFRELRFASGSDRELFPTMLDLAWGVYEGNQTAVTEAVSPLNNNDRVTLISFFLNHQQQAAAISLLRELSDIPDDDRRQLVIDLIRAEEFDAAMTIWRKDSRGESLVYNSKFEFAISHDEFGFGWRPTKLTQTIKIFLDVDRPHSGNRSLRLDYSGNFDETTPVLSQLIPVAANTHYRLTFFARTENLFSAGLPTVTISKANRERQPLGGSIPLPKGTSGWNSYSLEIVTTADTRAISLNIQRNPCNVKPCPVSGSAWFDDFKLEAVR